LPGFVLAFVVLADAWQDPMATANIGISSAGQKRTPDATVHLNAPESHGKGESAMATWLEIKPLRHVE
jgi:hypothetical protein